MLASSVTNAVILNAPNATNKVHSITVTCTIHPDGTVDQCVVMAMADSRVTRTGEILSYFHSYGYLHSLSIVPGVFV